MLRKSENNIIKLLTREIETNPDDNIKLERLNYFIDIISKKNKTMEEIKEINQFFQFDLETLGQTIASLISGYKNDHYESGFLKVDGPLETFEPNNPHLTIYDKPKPWTSVGMYVITNRTFKNGFILNDSESKRKERIFYLSGPYTLAYLEDIKNINWRTNKSQSIETAIFGYDFYSDGKFSIKLKQFESLPDYVQRFIEYLISYKISNGILTISSDKLEKLITKFLEEFKKYKARKAKGTTQIEYDFPEEKQHQGLEQTVGKALGLKQKNDIN